MKWSLILILILIFGFLGCAKEEYDSPSSSYSKTSKCPSKVAASSNLTLNPTIESTVVLHANGKDTTWNWQLSGTINTSYDVDVYDVDLFDTSVGMITTWQGQGKKVVCYFSAGSSENWRSDFDDFDTKDMGSTLDGWEGERWLDIRSLNVLNIMKIRMDLAVTKGCDAVEPDNMDGYTNDSCFSLTATDQLKYNQTIANYARSISLSVGLKNDPDQVDELEEYFDFSVTEQCYQYNECDSYQDFVANNKPVLNAEYETQYRTNPSRATVCSYSNTNDIQTLVLDLELDDSFRHSCD